MRMNIGAPRGIIEAALEDLQEAGRDRFQSKFRLVSA